MLLILELHKQHIFGEYSYLLTNEYIQGNLNPVIDVPWAVKKAKFNE